MSIKPLVPILLTSSVVAMDQSVALRDQNLRIAYTLESIGEWLRIAPTHKLIICDGSGFDFAPLIKDHFPSSDVECLYFKNQVELVQLYGKGFGEGEIIRHALEHSQFLQEANWFIKCTAKLWVNNFDACIQQWNGQFVCKAFFANVFSIKKTSLEYIDTRFYMSTKSFYLKHFLGAYKNLRADDGSSIEEEFLKVLRNLHLKNYLFRTSPVISGVGGGSGKYYKTSLTRQIKENIRTKLVAYNSKFQELFI